MFELCCIAWWIPPNLDVAEVPFHCCLVFSCLHVVCSLPVLLIDINFSRWCTYITGITPVRASWLWCFHFIRDFPSRDIFVYWLAIICFIFLNNDFCVLFLTQFAWEYRSTPRTRRTSKASLRSEPLLTSSLPARSCTLSSWTSLAELRFLTVELEIGGA